MSAPTSQTQSLAEALPVEIERCRTLLFAKKTDGSTAVLLDSFPLAATITRAEAALTSGDHLAMLRSYQELKDHE